MTSQLGKLKNVSIRTIWKNEQQDFTPWLAEEENIGLLGTAIGMELEVENIEVPVGPYSADILAKDSGSDRYVVIENQYGKTNHDHLGKMLTYGAVLDASTVVWLAEEFTDEHKKAVDWLNDHTDDHMALFAVRIELWRIDGSSPAVRFNVVSRPADILKNAAAVKASGPLTETRRLQLDFWTEFRQRLLSSSVLPSAQTARPQYWFDISLGRSGIHLSAIANTYENRIGLRVYMTSKVADIALSQLEPQRQEIEREIGEPLSWNPNPENRDKTIALTRDADIRLRDKWPEYIDWLVGTVRSFRKSFGPRVKKLDLTAVLPEVENET